MTDTVKTGLDYGCGKVSRLFSKIFFPTLLGMVFNALLTITDGVIVGQGVGPDGIAAVNIIAPLFMVATGFGLMFGIGAAVMAGICLAQNDVRRANIAMTHAFTFSLAAMVVIITAGVLFTDEIAHALGSSERLIGKTTDYLFWLMPGILFLTFQSIGMMVIRLDGSPTYAMLCNIIPAVINGILDFIFVFPLDMGVKGASIATSISTIIGGLMAVTYFFRFSYVLRFVFSLANISRNFINQVKIGSSAFVTEIAMSIMMLTGNHVFMSTWREAGVAAYSIACYLFPLIFMINNAVAQSAQPIISYNYGAGNIARVWTSLRVSVAAAIICGTIASCGIGFGAHSIAGLFIDPDCEAARLATQGLPIFSSCAIFFALNISFIGFYQSTKQALRAIVLTLLRGIILLVPLFFIMPRIFPDYGPWAAIPCSEILTFAITVLSFRRRLP